MLFLFYNLNVYGQKFNKQKTYIDALRLANIKNNLDINEFDNKIFETIINKYGDKSELSSNPFFVNDGPPYEWFYPTPLALRIIGSSSIKRRSNINISINGYVGITGGYETVSSSQKQRSCNIGLSAPIGISATLLGNLTVFMSFIDLGSIVNQRIVVMR